MPGSYASHVADMATLVGIFPKLAMLFGDRKADLFESAICSGRGRG